MRSTNNSLEKSWKKWFGLGATFNLLVFLVEVDIHVGWTLFQQNKTKKLIPADKVIISHLILPLLTDMNGTQDSYMNLK